MHRIQLTTKNNNNKNSNRNFSTNISIDPTSDPTISLIFIAFVLFQHSIMHSIVQPAFRIRSLIYSSSPAHAQNETIVEREKWKKKKKQNGGREIREERGMEELKKKNTPRSEWIADTTFDEINLLSDAIKYLSIQYHPSSALLLFFSFSFLFSFFVFHSWKAEGVRVACLVRWFVTWNDAWVTIAENANWKPISIPPPLADYRWTDATARSFETEEELHSFARIYLWYVSLPRWSLFSSCDQSLLNMDERKLKICF